MDSSGIETKATNAVRGIIVESEYLDQFIKDKDKEPSFLRFYCTMETGRFLRFYVMAMPFFIASCLHRRGWPTF